MRRGWEAEARNWAEFTRTAGHESPEPAVLADAAALPFRDGTFGLVVAYMSLLQLRAVKP